MEMHNSHQQQLQQQQQEPHLPSASFLHTVAL
jgi:hypothetical protein